MSNNFSPEYSKRGDDELLSLASDRASLTPEAAAALNAELHRRNLTGSDEAKYQHFAKRERQRELGRRRRKIFGSWRDRRSWVEFFWALVVMGLISVTYLALPDRYRMKPDWQEAAVHVMFASVFIAVASSVWRRRIRFWIVLVISSTAHLVIVHRWLQRVGSFGRNQDELAVLLGFVLFFAIYGVLWTLRRSLYGQEAHEKI